MLEQLTNRDYRRVAVCVLISIISLLFVQKYFTAVFPDASINMDVTKDEAHIIAEKFLANRGHDVEGYIHASKFGYLNDAKEFLEFELPADSAGTILNNTNSYYWKNRWFIPEKEEEYYVKISTTGNIAEFDHTINEDAVGDSLSKEKAIYIAEFFLVGSIGIDIKNWELVESKLEKRKNRWDHRLEWKEKSFNINESTHRITILVQGANVDYYNEWIKVPDTWKREYEKLRSKNGLLGSIGGFGTILTLFLIFLMIFVRSRKNDIHWKTALIYSLIAGIIMLLVQLNELPLQMYWFDNKDSYFSFLTEVIFFQCILIPLGIGLFFSVLIAGSEPLYRDQYPHHISFRHILTAQGIRSRSFFNSAIIGISLTFATFAFQTIYYLVANNLGAWAPGQVPNLDRYATYIPWVGVLLGGFFPAVQEESLSRMFSIPFLQKYTKSTIFAVLISSIIWGLAHAGYPAQPFYIRVIEVSAMGIFISWIFIRYGILATLIWHFSVDAVYSAMILLRSSNPYYFTTGAVCAGLVLLPLIYAIVAYRKSGGFISSNHLVNALDTEIVEEKTETKEMIDQSKISESYKPLNPNRVKLGLGIGIIGILLFYYVSVFEKPNETIYNFAYLDKNRNEAIEIAREYLIKRGFNLEDYRSVANAENWMEDSGGDPLGKQNINVAYIMEYGGKDTLRKFLSEDILGSIGWKVRFFKPETKKEYKVYMLAKRDEPGHPHFVEILSDTASLPFISQAKALSLVHEFAANTDIDLTNMDITEEEILEKDNRTDYHFTFNGNVDHKGSISEAKIFYNIDVHGNHIGSIDGGLKLPELWKREFNQSNFYRNIHMFSFFLIFIILGIFGIRYLLQLIKDNQPNWKFVLSFSGVILFYRLIEVLNTANLLNDYGTEKPINIFIFQLISGSIIGGVFLAIICGILVLAIQLAWPNFFSAFNKINRKNYLKDAFISLASSFGIFSIYAGINNLLTIYHPHFIESSAFSVHRINSYFPFLSILGDEGIFGSLMLMLLVVGLVYIYNRLIAVKRFSKYIVLFIMSIPFVLPPEPEALYLFVNIIWFLSLLLLIRYFWRFNPLSFLLGAFGFFVLPEIISYLFSIHDPSYRIQIISALFCFGSFLLFFLREIFTNQKAAP